MLRFKTKGRIFDVAVTAFGGLFSVGVMLYAVAHFGLKESWPELVLNMFYLACLSGYDVDVFLQQTEAGTVQLLVFGMYRHNGTVTRHPFRTSAGILCSAPCVSCPRGSVASHAYVFLFA